MTPLQHGAKRSADRREVNTTKGGTPAPKVVACLPALRVNGSVGTGNDHIAQKQKNDTNGL